MPAGAPPRRVLHAIHDFLPRHLAGSEVYAFDLCRALSSRHHVTVLAAEYDPARPNGHVEWRVENGLPVAELVNNWVGGTFEESYRPRVITERLGQLLDVVQPDVLHLHSLLNLSLYLPALAIARNIPIAATLHDYTLVCPSGGQRMHRADAHYCDTIDPSRCARCFTESPFHRQLAFGRVSRATRRSALVGKAAALVRRSLPIVAEGLAALGGRAAGLAVSDADITTRLAHVRKVFEQVDLFVAPSRFLADEFIRLGVAPTRMQVLEHGFLSRSRVMRAPAGRKLRVGFVGTIVWHKGLDVIIEAVRHLAPDSYEVKIFGDPNVFPDYTARLRDASTGLPVQFMGPFERDRTMAVYSEIDVLVVPSIWPENSPLVIREAFMAGIPIVASRVGGLSEIVTDGRNGVLYDPRSPGDLASVLRRLAADRTTLDALAAHIPPVKTMEVHADEWSSLYDDLVARRSRMLAS